MSQSFVCLFNGVWVGIPHTGLTLRFMGLSGNCLVMVLSLTVLCTLFEFGMSLSNEWQFYTKFVIFIKGTNKSLLSSESLFTALMTGQCPLFVFYCCWLGVSCNNVAPVTNLCLGRATTRSHSSQWSKKKVAVET